MPAVVGDLQQPSPNLFVTSTDEVRRWLFATGVKQQAERDRNVEVDPKNVSFQGGAKADSRLEIQETAEGRATMRIRRVSDHRADTSVQQLGTYP
nr:hypothetical protein Pyn_06004 [Ipomoea batatas]